MFHKRTYFKTKCGKVGLEVTLYDDGSRLAIFEYREMGGHIKRSHWSVPKGISQEDLLDVTTDMIRICKRNASRPL